MKRPRLNVLRTFAAAGNALSFSTAAEVLNISQAAVSQQIRQLEAQLGAALFMRHNRRLTLTASGKAYLAAVHEALDRLDTITDQLFPDRQGQTVTIRCTAGIATLWLTPGLAGFKASHPGIDLRIRTLDQSYGAAGSQFADLEIAPVSPDAPATGRQHLLTSIVTPVCAPHLLPDERGLSDAAQIASFELIHVLGYAVDWHRWFRAHELTERTIPKGIVFDGSLMALEATLRGDGIMLGRRPFIDQHIKSGELVEPFAGRYSLTTDYALVMPAVHNLTQDIKTVVNWIEGLAGKPHSAASDASLPQRLRT